MKQKYSEGAPQEQVFLLGIDAGGTHTDAVFLVQEPPARKQPMPDQSTQGQAMPDQSIQVQPAQAEGCAIASATLTRADSRNEDTLPGLEKAASATLAHARPAARSAHMPSLRMPLPHVRLLAAAKVPTKHDDLPASVGEVLAALARALDENAAAAAFATAAATAAATNAAATITSSASFSAPFSGGAALLGRTSRVTLGATLAVNALVQGKTDAVGLALSAGPGLDPRRFALGEHVCVVPGGLDHRGTEISPLITADLEKQAARWREDGIAAVACVGKFSPRNAAHEQKMAQAVRRGAETSVQNASNADAQDALCITLGHRLSGRLNFPRRIATAYFNASVQRLHSRFLDAVENALAKAGVRAAVRLLKADGGAVPLCLSRREPVQSILSGPAASVMGVLALCPAAREGCSLLLDMGGTTTDMALVVDGSPVVDRDGMVLQGRRTLVRALASVSIGVGGDSLLTVNGHGAGASLRVGPERQGPAVAFGGSSPTLLDALNVLHSSSQNRKAGTDAARPYGPAGEQADELADEPNGRLAVELAGQLSEKLAEELADELDRKLSGKLADELADELAGELAGDVSASLSALQALARQYGLAPHDLARRAVASALEQIKRAAEGLVAGINAQPIYTLAGLRALQEAHPTRVWLVGGPAACMGPHLAAALHMPVDCPPHTAVANAVGAALTLPTDALEVYADTGSGLLRAPALDLTENIRRGFSLDALGQRARELLLQRMEQAGAEDAAVEITEAESYATLEENGFGSKDMRVSCQAVPGLAGMVVQES